MQVDVAASHRPKQVYPVTENPCKRYLSILWHGKSDFSSCNRWNEHLPLVLFSFDRAAHENIAAGLCGIDWEDEWRVEWGILRVWYRLLNPSAYNKRNEKDSHEYGAVWMCQAIRIVTFQSIVYWRCCDREFLFPTQQHLHNTYRMLRCAFVSNDKWEMKIEKSMYDVFQPCSLHLYRAQVKMRKTITETEIEKAKQINSTNTVHRDTHITQSIGRSCVRY